MSSITDYKFGYVCGWMACYYQQIENQFNDENRMENYINAINEMCGRFKLTIDNLLELVGIVAICPEIVDDETIGEYVNVRYNEVEYFIGFNNDGEVVFVNPEPEEEPDWKCAREGCEKKGSFDEMPVEVEVQDTALAGCVEFYCSKECVDLCCVCEEEPEEEQREVVVKRISFEGVNYLKDRENGDIYDYDYHKKTKKSLLIGRWNADLNVIIFYKPKPKPNPNEERFYYKICQDKGDNFKCDVYFVTFTELIDILDKQGFKYVGEKSFDKLVGPLCDGDYNKKRYETQECFDWCMK